MKYLVLFSLISSAVALTLRTNLDEEWQKWKQTYKKSYVTIEEENNRRASWEKNLHFVNSHNSRPDKQFTLHMNQFADRDSNKDHRENRDETANKMYFLPEVPTEMDWRDNGVITPVQNQGQEGDSQALVAAETVSSFHAIRTGTLYELSAQEIDDCGCGSQLVQKDIFGCIHRNIGGLCRAEDYKQSSVNKCNKNSCTTVAQVTGSIFINRGDEEQMGLAILKNPLMVYIDASRTSFELYQSGIYSDPDCNPTDIDHVLQVVGYGVLDNKDYWICKNSWGVDWGNQGYIWIERGKNMCGIASMALYPY